MPGFEKPTVTLVPDTLFDLHLAHLSAPQLRVLLYAIRHTYGWKRPSDDIALSQFMAGVRTRDGRVLDEGTGLSRTACKDAINVLCRLGLLEKTPQRLEQENRDWANRIRVTITDEARRDSGHVFQQVNVTPVPDELFDYWLPVHRLTDSELKALLYIIRRTLGFAKRSDVIKLVQFVEGITTKRGTRLDSGCGLKKSALYMALRGLQDKGLISAEGRTDMHKGSLPPRYSIVFASALPIEREIDPRLLPEVDDACTLPGSESTGPRVGSEGTQVRTAPVGRAEACGCDGGEEGSSRRIPPAAWPERGGLVAGEQGASPRNAAVAEVEAGERGSGDKASALAAPQYTDSNKKQRQQETIDQETHQHQQASLGVGAVLHTEDEIVGYNLRADEVLIETPEGYAQVMSLVALVQRDLEDPAAAWGVRNLTEAYFSPDHFLGRGGEEWTPEERRKHEAFVRLRRDLAELHRDIGAVTLDEALAQYFTADLVERFSSDDPVELQRVRGWLRYVRVDSAKSLLNPAGFLRSRLESDQWPPRGGARSRR
jgi:hypothetical protein